MIRDPALDHCSECSDPLDEPDPDDQYSGGIVITATGFAHFLCDWRARSGEQAA